MLCRAAQSLKVGSPWTKGDFREVFKRKSTHLGTSRPLSLPSDGGDIGSLVEIASLL